MPGSSRRVVRDLAFLPGRSPFFRSDPSLDSGHTEKDDEADTADKHLVTIHKHSMVSCCLGIGVRCTMGTARGRARSLMPYPVAGGQRRPRLRYGSSCA